MAPRYNSNYQNLISNLIQYRLITTGDLLKVIGTNNYATITDRGTLLINGENPVNNINEFISSLGIEDNEILDKIECRGYKLSFLYKKIMELKAPRNQNIGNHFNNPKLDYSYRMLLYEQDDQVPYWLTNRYPLYNNIDNELFIKRYLEMDIQVEINTGDNFGVPPVSYQHESPKYSTIYKQL